MIINKENIDEVTFDYLEGNLSLEEIDAYKKYLELHPETKDQLIYWKQSFVSEINLKNEPTFSHLKKKSKIIYYVSAIAIVSFVASLVFYNQKGDKLNQFNDTDIKTFETNSQINQTVSPVNNDAAFENEENNQKLEIKEKPIQRRKKLVNKPSIVIKNSNEKISPINKKKIFLNREQRNRSIQPMIKEDNNSEVITTSKNKKQNKDVDVIELNSEGF